jgi:very-short-patch-repair endonuclease
VNQRFWSLCIAIARQRDQNLDERLRSLANRQHGVISRAQLLHLGLTPSAISHRRRQGWLHLLHCRVYSIGWADPDRYGRWMGAVLACGRDALLSHQSAAELWEIRKAGPGPIEITLTTASKRRVDGLAIHRRTVLGPPDRRARHGIPVTSPTRTLADLALRLSTVDLESAVNEAARLDLIDPERLRGELENMRGEAGTKTLLRLLDRQVFRLTDSELERFFLRLVRGAHLRVPETGVWLNGFRVDFFWPELGLVVETDGLRYHRTPAQQAQDRRRDQVLTAAGLTTLRFTHAQIHFERGEVRATLLRVVASLSARRAAA